MTDWPEVAEALKKGYADSGYAEAWRRATEVELAKHGNEAGAARDAGNRVRALDWSALIPEGRDRRE